jgi:hypothetical protein
MRCIVGRAGKVRSMFPTNCKVAGRIASIQTPPFIGKIRIKKRNSMRGILR